MRSEAVRFREGVFYSMGFVMILWFIKSIEMLMSIELGFLGILPRNLLGTVGIITSPLIHGDILHLLSNSFPLILLGIGVIYFYNKIAKVVFIWIYLMTGIWVWIVAREAYHIGASGIVYGLVSFLFFSGLFRRDARSIAISLVVVFLYSGMLAGLFPTNSSVSWESHLLGAFAGVFCAFYFRNIPLYDKDLAEVEEIEAVVDNAPMYDISNFTNSPVQATTFMYYFKSKELKETVESTPRQKIILTYTGKLESQKDESKFY
ncbi:MAG: rhomboid family intramembrane serine protease [Bacteroidota bacterium]|nr:rhomboid family intramembrane serine protease [Bacteroidota bacterium]